MSSYDYPKEFLELMEGEAKAQGITEEILLKCFKEDYPQDFYILFETEKHPRKLTEAETNLSLGLFLGYSTGFVRRGAF